MEALRAIEALNRRDVQFALANDARMMMSQWTDDIVLLQPKAPITRGRAAIAEAFRSVEGPELVDYVLDIQEVEVVGDHAFQWGTCRYSMRPRGGVLQRQPDGSWRIHRGMTTVD
jgi:ketosteroid isomerase-like protein